MLKTSKGYKSLAAITMIEWVGETHIKDSPQGVDPWWWVYRIDFAHSLGSEQICFKTEKEAREQMDALVARMEEAGF